MNDKPKTFEELFKDYEFPTEPLSSMMVAGVGAETGKVYLLSRGTTIEEIAFFATTFIMGIDNMTHRQDVFEVLSKALLGVFADAIEHSRDHLYSTKEEPEEKYTPKSQEDTPLIRIPFKQITGLA